MKTYFYLEPWCQTGPHCYFVSIVGDDNTDIFLLLFKLLLLILILLILILIILLLILMLLILILVLRNFDSCREYYSYWTGYYGLPVAGWNAGNDGKDYYNHKA